MTFDQSIAQTQYFTRPVHQRHNLDTFLAATRAEAQASTEELVNVKNIRFEVLPDRTIGIAGRPLTYHAFSQACALAGAPPNHYRDILKPETAVLALNECWAQQYAGSDSSDQAKLLIRGNGSIRALNGPKYSRLFSAILGGAYGELAARYGLKTPPAWSFGDDPRTRPATKNDVGPFTLVQEGDLISPAGCYYGPEDGSDTFGFLVSDRAIKTPTGTTQFRAIMFRHSETGGAGPGKKSAHAVRMYLEAACGNHRLIGATDIKETRVIHRGDRLDERLGDQIRELADWLESSMAGEEEALEASARAILGSTPALVAKKAASLTGLAVSTVRKAIEAVSPRSYGDPASAYSVASRLTEYSQTQSFVADRVEIDEAASVLYAYGN